MEILVVLDGRTLLPIDRIAADRPSEGQHAVTISHAKIRALGGQAMGTWEPSLVGGLSWPVGVMTGKGHSDGIAALALRAKD
ncbi:hypothetical protein ACWCQS_32970 [Streptomyces sp. NPDC002076]